MAELIDLIWSSQNLILVKSNLIIDSHLIIVIIADGLARFRSEIDRIYIWTKWHVHGVMLILDTHLNILFKIRGSHLILILIETVSERNTWSRPSLMTIIEGSVLDLLLMHFL